MLALNSIEFIADDLGLDETTNHAIERCHREGVLTGASLMLGQPGTAHGIEVALRNPALRIGWHFHACDSRPLTCEQWPWGRSAAGAGFAMALLPSARALVRGEIRAQWEGFEASGLSCQFINSHHHIHIHPFLAREMRSAVATTFGGWIRSFNVESFEGRGMGATRCLRRPSRHWLRAWDGVRRSDSLWGLDRLFSMKDSEIARAVTRLPGGLHEFVFHPRGGPGDADMRALLALRSHPGFERLRELR